MHSKKLVHYRVVLSPIQIYVKAQMMRLCLMKKIRRQSIKKPILK